MKTVVDPHFSAHTILIAIDRQKSWNYQYTYVTHGIVSSRKSTFDHCHMVKVKTPFPEGFSPIGMSGSALYGMDRSGNVRFGGAVIEFNEYTNEYMVIGAAILSGLLGHENA